MERHILSLSSFQYEWNNVHRLIYTFFDVKAPKDSRTRDFKQLYHRDFEMADGLANFII